jgi:hypothetical protein
MRFCINKTGPVEVKRTAKPISRKTGINNGVTGMMQAQSKNRLAPERDHALTRDRTR